MSIYYNVCGQSKRFTLFPTQSVSNVTHHYRLNGFEWDGIHHSLQGPNHGSFSLQPPALPSELLYFGINK